MTRWANRIIHAVFLALALLASPGAARGAEQPAPAPGAPAEAPAARRTPASTLRTFLAAMAEHEEGDSRAGVRALECLDFTGFSGLRVDDARMPVANRLARILRWMNAEQAVASDPAASQPDTETGEFNLPLERAGRAFTARLEKDGSGGWRFSGSTLASVERAHAEIFGSETPLTTMVRAVGLGSLVGKRFFGLSLHVWIGLAVLVLLSVMVQQGVMLMARVFARQYLRRHRVEKSAQVETEKLIRRTARPFGWIGAWLVVYALLPTLDLPLQAQGLLRVVSKALALGACVWAAFRVVDLVAEKVRATAALGDPGFRRLLVPMVSKALKLFILAVGVVFIAESFGLPITSLIAGVGLAGAAVALAAKGTLENIFGSFSVVLDKPFRVGDRVIIGTVDGVVEEVGFRSTRIRTGQGSLVTVPNATLLAANIDNWGVRDRWQFKAVLGLVYGTPPDRIEAFCDAVRALLTRRAAPGGPAPSVYLTAFSPSSLDVQAVGFLPATAPANEAQDRHVIMLEILREADRLGIGFAFPTQTLHVASLPPNAGETPVQESEQWSAGSERAAQSPARR